MAGANPTGVNMFTVAHNAIETAARNGAINITTFHNQGHFNTGLVHNKSSVTSRVCPIKLVTQVTSNFRTARYILERDYKYSSEYEAEFTQPIGILRTGTGTGRFVYLKIRKEEHPEYKNIYKYYVVTVTVTAMPRLNVSNGRNSRSFDRTIQNAAVIPDW